MEEQRPSKSRLNVSYGLVDRNVSWYPGTSDRAIELMISRALHLSEPFVLVDKEDETIVPISASLPSGIQVSVCLTPDAAPPRQSGLDRRRTDQPPEAVGTGDDDSLQPMLFLTPRETVRKRRDGETSPLSQIPLDEIHDGRSSTSHAENDTYNTYNRVTLDNSLRRMERCSTELANERTFLAWIRTTLSCFSLAFHFVDFKGDGDLAAVIIFILGGGFAICAITIFYHGVDRRSKVLKILRSPDPHAHWDRKTLTPLKCTMGLLFSMTFVMYFVGSIYQGTGKEFYGAGQDRSIDSQ